MIVLKEGYGQNEHDNSNVGIEKEILYPGVYTCLTITCVTNDFRIAGAHLAHFMNNKRIGNNLKHIVNLINGRQILTVHLVGMLGSHWSPCFNARDYNWEHGKGNNSLIKTMKGNLKLKAGVKFLCYDLSKLKGKKTFNVKAKLSNMGLTAQISYRPGKEIEQLIEYKDYLKLD